MIRLSTIGVLLTAALTSAPLSAAPDVRVPSGTRLRVRLLQFISSETSAPADPVAFEVAQDVTVNGVVVIHQGTPVAGAIVEASPFHFSRSWWFGWPRPRRGHLVVTATQTEALDGQTIRLQLLRRSRVEGVRMHQPLMRWWHEGKTFDAMIDGDYVIRDGVIRSPT